MDADLLFAVLSGAIVTYLSQLLRNLLATREAKLRAAEAKFSTALQSDDLATLAAYLRDDLGAIPVADYLTNAGVRRDVDRYLSRLAAFVAAPVGEDTAPQEPESKGPEVSEARNSFADPDALRPDAGDPPQITRALATLGGGDTWSALAGLRRDLEVALRALRERGPEGVLGLGPGHQSGRFSITTDVPQDAALNLRRFWRTASAAVHGQPVSLAEAVEAIADARAVYASVDRALARLSPNSAQGGDSVQKPPP